MIPWYGHVTKVRDRILIKQTSSIFLLLSIVTIRLLHLWASKFSFRSQRSYSKSWREITDTNKSNDTAVVIKRATIGFMNIQIIKHHTVGVIYGGGRKIKYSTGWKFSKIFLKSLFSNDTLNCSKVTVETKEKNCSNHCLKRLLFKWMLDISNQIVMV